jgi:hypothetical protein
MSHTDNAEYVDDFKCKVHVGEKLSAREFMHHECEDCCWKKFFYINYDYARGMGNTYKDGITPIKGVMIVSDDSLSESTSYSSDYIKFEGDPTNVYEVVGVHAFRHADAKLLVYWN